MPASDPPGPRRVLVTGFGPFPGVPRNPSAAVVAELRRYRAVFARRGFLLTTQVLPVRYADCAAFTPHPAPDAIVHVGVAGRRRAVSVETRAHHRRSPRHPDASGRAPTTLSGPQPLRHVAAAWRAPLLAVALRRAGVPAKVSRDAGAYVCNALLYRSLESAAVPAAFVHIPPASVCQPVRVARALARTLPDTLARLAMKS